MKWVEANHCLQHILMRRMAGGRRQADVQQLTDFLVLDIARGKGVRRAETPMAVRAQAVLVQRNRNNWTAPRAVYARTVRPRLWQPGEGWRLWSEPPRYRVAARSLRIKQAEAG